MTRRKPPEPPEEEVAVHRGSHLLVLGGPGSGKTSLLERRYLALAQELAPHRILFLCNARTYSSEARDRLFGLLPVEASLEVPVYTWHALAYHLVSRYYTRLGYREQPVLLTAPEQWGVVKELLADEDPEEWEPWVDRMSDNAFVDEVADFCLRVQQKVISEEDLQALVGARPAWRPVARFAGTYRDHLRERARLDYAGLIHEAVRLLLNDTQVRSSLTRRFPHVLVDDAEEMSPAHVNLLETLRDSTICIAADPDSGVEKFRGAEPDWIYGFGARFPGSETVYLPRSHRIGAPLGPALARLAAENEPDDGHRPTGWASSRTDYECRLYGSLWEEVEAISRHFRLLHVMEGTPFEQMAVVLSQPGRLLRPIERALGALDVPYRAAFGDRSLSSEPPVRSFLDLARFALKAPGWQEALPDLLVSPLGGLDFTARRRLEREAWASGQTLAEVAEQARECDELRRLRDVILSYSARADESFWQVWCASSFYRGLAEQARQDDARAPASERASRLASSLQAISAFSHSLERFVERRRGAASIGDYLKEAARADFGSDPWMPPASGEGAGVTICSFHAAKGRQWDQVVVAGCLESWIPKGSRAQGLFDPFALEIPETTGRQIEALADDRRTFYVAASRARRKVLFTVSAPPGGRGRPSRFLSELAGELPEPAIVQEPPPLTVPEFAADLRRRLATPESTPADRAAAVAALAEVPGIDPSRWYGVRDWTPGTVPLVEGKFRTSYSRLSPFENCGLQYVLQSVLGLDHESTHSMKFGTWLHALFEAVHKKEIRDPEVLRAEYDRLFNEKIFPNATIARQFRKDGEKMLKVFWENEVDPRTIESEYKFEDVEVAGASIRGRIDRIDQVGKTLKLTDYKTSKSAPSFGGAERSLQLALYHLAAREDPRLSALGRPAVARLVYPGAFTKRGEYRVLSQNAEQADSVLEELPAMIGKVVDEDFKPNPAADCYFCRMKVLCPLWPAGREVPA